MKTFYCSSDQEKCKEMWDKAMLLNDLLGYLAFSLHFAYPECYCHVDVSSANLKLSMIS